MNFWRKNIPPLHERIVFAFESRTYVWRPQLVQRMMRADSHFRCVIERCDKVIEQLLGWSLVQELERPFETSRYNLTEELFEPTLAAVSIAQVEMWRQRGIIADAVMGLSGGEFTAAYTAGVLSLEETLEITCEWSRFLRTQRVNPGTMVWVNVDWERATRLANELASEISPVVEWNMNATIFAGQVQAIESLIKLLERASIPFQRLQTDFSYHNARSFVDGDEFAHALGLRPRSPTMPMYSAFTGGLLRDGIFDGHHWEKMISSPAFVVRAFRKIFEDGYERVLAIGMTSKALYPVHEIATAMGVRVQVSPSLSCLIQNEIPFPRESATRRVWRRVRPRTTVTVNND